MDQVDHLVEECKSGSQRAQIEIYRLYHKQVFNTCLRLVCNKVDAEDMMQNAFIDALTNISRYKGPDTFAGWIKRIAVNNCIDFLKKRKIEPESREMLPDLAEEQSEAEEYELKLKVETVKAAMNEIHSDYRIILSLHLFEGMDNEEICLILKLKEGNVRTRLSRAKKALLECIKNIEVHHEKKMMTS
jgi:RNA polymerase sigma-70 factor (ECF subfamily)